MKCDVAGCGEVVTDEAMRLHKIIVNLDSARAQAWRDLYGDATTPCGSHIINGLAYMNAVVLQGRANGAGELSNSSKSTQAAAPKTQA